MRFYDAQGRYTGRSEHAATGCLVSLWRFAVILACVTWPAALLTRRGTPGWIPWAAEGAWLIVLGLGAAAWNASRR